MIAPLQSAPYENIISVTFSKDPKEKKDAQDKLDQAMGKENREKLGRFAYSGTAGLMLMLLAPTIGKRLARSAG